MDGAHLSICLMALIDMGLVDSPKRDPGWEVSYWSWPDSLFGPSQPEQSADFLHSDSSTLLRQIVLPLVQAGCGRSSRFLESPAATSSCSASSCSRSTRGGLRLCCRSPRAARQRPHAPPPAQGRTCRCCARSTRCWPTTRARRRCRRRPSGCSTTSTSSRRRPATSTTTCRRRSSSDCRASPPTSSPGCRGSTRWRSS